MLRGCSIKRQLVVVIMLLIIFRGIYAQVNSNHVKVKGYYRQDGTYVNPHYRTAPNSTNHDNFSTLGNTNPYTGEKGTILPDIITPSSNDERIKNNYIHNQQPQSLNNSILDDNPLTTRTLSNLYEKNQNFRIIAGGRGKFNQLDNLNPNEMRGLLLFSNDKLELVVKNSNIFLRISDYLVYTYENGAIEIQTDYYWEEYKKRAKVYTFMYQEGDIIVLIVIGEDVLYYNVNSIS